MNTVPLAPSLRLRATRRRLRVYVPTPSPTEGKNDAPTEHPHLTPPSYAGQVREDGGSGRARVTCLAWS